MDGVYLLILLTKPIPSIYAEAANFKYSKFQVPFNDSFLFFPLKKKKFLSITHATLATISSLCSLNNPLSLSAPAFTKTAVVQASNEWLNPLVSSQSSVLYPSAAFDTTDPSLLFKHSSLASRPTDSPVPVTSSLFPLLMSPDFPNF